MINIELKETWQQTNGPFGGNIKAVAMNDTVIFAAIERELFYSFNNGTSWVKSDFPGYEIRSIIIDGNNVFVGTNSELYLSTDKGKSWNKLYNLPNYHSSSIEYIHCLALFRRNLLSTTPQGVFASKDNGQEWFMVETGKVLNSVSSIVVSNKKAYIGTLYEGCILSDGANCREINNGLPANIYSLAISGSNIFAGTSDGVYLTRDEGSTWNAVNNGIKCKYIKHLLVSTSGNLFALGDSTDDIFTSTDEGLNWTHVNSGLAKTMISSAAIFNKDLLIGTPSGVLPEHNRGGGVYLSTNEGANLTSIGLPKISVTKLVASGTALIAITRIEGNFNEVVYVSRNNGKSWDEIVDPNMRGNYIHSISVVGEKLFACTAGGLYISRDMGYTWTKIFDDYYTPLSELIAIGPILFAGSYRGMYFSRDNGISWTSINEGLSIGKSSINDEGPSPFEVIELAVSGHNIYAAVSIYGIGSVFLSSDNGIYWKDISNGLPDQGFWVEDVYEPYHVPFEIFSLAVCGNCLLVGTSDGIYVSFNKGETWIFSCLKGTPVFALTVNGNNIFAGTHYHKYGSCVFKAVCIGESLSPWTMLEMWDIPVSALAVEDGDLFAGTLDSGVWKLSDFITQ